MEQNEAKRIVQAGLDLRRSESRFHREDKEVIGVIAGKHEAERQAQAEAQRRIHERFETERRRILQQEEDLRIQEEELEAEREACRKDLHKAAVLAAALGGMGGLFLIGAWRQDVAMITGGLFLLSSLTVIGLGLVGWKSI